MNAFRWMLLGPVLLTVMTAVVCAIPSTVTLRRVDDRDLAAITGGACRGIKADPNFCSGDPECLGPLEGGRYLHVEGTGDIKKWCDTNTSNKVCDCNQSGVTQDPCTEETLCYDANCTDCDEPAVATTVQTSVNLNGAPCTSDDDCDS